MQWVMNMAQDVLTAEQAADFLQTSRDTVLRKARAGTLPAAKLGREWRFRRADLDAWLAAGGDRYEALVEEGMAIELAKRKRADTGRRTALAKIKARHGS
jgi:excisionase family DNA binding protein